MDVYLVELLTWLEASALGQAVRGAGVWSYALINLAHIVGVATLFGSVLILDLKLLGLFPRAPLAIVAVTSVPMAIAGFLFAATSGICLLATNATDYKSNPFLLIKFGGRFRRPVQFPAGAPDSRMAAPLDEHALGKGPSATGNGWRNIPCGMGNRSHRRPDDRLLVARRGVNEKGPTSLPAPHVAAPIAGCLTYGGLLPTDSRQ